MWHTELDLEPLDGSEARAAATWISSYIPDWIVSPICYFIADTNLGAWEEQIV